jgi:hypothetical protein
MAIDTMAHEAFEGNPNTLASLYKIANRATSSLNGLPINTLKPLAGELQVWPLNLTTVTAWNQNQIKQRFQLIELGKNTKPVVDLEAVLKRSAPSNALGALLVELVEYCRRYGEIITGRRLLKLPDENDKAVEAFRNVSHRMGRIAAFLNIPWPRSYEQDAINEVEKLVYRYSEMSVNLPAVNDPSGGSKRWFVLGMDFVEELTGGKYYEEKHGLLGMNRKRKDFPTPGDIKAGIRQGIKEGFDAAVAHVKVSAFVKL